MLASGACSSGDEANPLAGLSDPGGDPATYVAFFDGLPDLSEPTATTDWTERGRATVDALQSQLRPDEVAKARGKAPEELFPPALLAAYRSAELMKSEAGS